MRVAIIGGGCAGMTAAFELSRPSLRGKYEVTVYQVGHRLGGKGASGRRPDGRIEEHGLHLWMGYYENAFSVLRQCYEELDRDPRACPIVDLETAFEPAPVVGLTERGAAGDWLPWLASFPVSAEMPGDPRAESPFTVRSYLARSAELLVELLRSANDLRDPREHPRKGRRRASKEEDEETSPLVEATDRVLKYGQLATTAAMIEAAETLRRGVLSLLPPRAKSARAMRDNPLLRVCAALADAARRQLEVILDADQELSRVWQVIDILLAMTRGILMSGVAFRHDGFDALDAHDYRDWLRDHGASERSLDGAFLRGVYDLLFAYEGGRADRPRFAAGVAVRGTLRMFFTYRGALFFRMNAGMGDVVFAPMYEALKKRGVKFEFFHRLRNIGVAPDSAIPEGEEPWVTSLQFDVQAKIAGGGEYRPLVPFGGLPSWPVKAIYEQLEGGKSLRREDADFESHWDEHVAEKKTLRVGEDFDLAILAVGLGALPHVAPDLVARSTRFRDAVRKVKTVATQAFQIWMKSDMRSLGWRGGRTNVSAFVEPFDTWADMSHLLPLEGWAGGARSVAYFCSVLPDQGKLDDEGHLAARRAHVKQGAIDFLRRDVRSLWPKAVDARGEMRWDVLTGDAEIEGEARFDSHYWTANVSPSDRYVMALPGTTIFRISPLDPGFSNFTVAGDWTESGLNAGCVESAVMSGRLAAHALSGSPALEEIIGYDHP